MGDQGIKERPRQKKRNLKVFTYDVLEVMTGVSRRTIKEFFYNNNIDASNPYDVAKAIKTLWKKYGKD